MTSKILKLFVNTVTANDKNSLINRDNLTKRIEIHYSQKQRHVSQLFSAFLNFTSNFQHFQQKMTLIGYVFPKLRTLKDVVR